MRLFLLTFIIMVSITSQSWADACYSKEEAEAEQGIRIHSELMVIGLNCQHMTPKGWTNFYSQYRDITRKHQDIFASYETTMLSYYRRTTGTDGAERKLHNLRTDFSNKTSTNAAQMRPDVFCATYAPRIPAVAKMSRSEFQSWTANAAITQRQTHSICN